jgi:hypothetical protein
MRYDTHTLFGRFLLLFVIAGQMLVSCTVPRIDDRASTVARATVRTTSVAIQVLPTIALPPEMPWEATVTPAISRHTSVPGQPIDAYDRAGSDPIVSHQLADLAERLPKQMYRTAYTAYVQAAVKFGQTYKSSCEFEAGWVILQSYGFDVTIDELISRLPQDLTIQPTVNKTSDGFIIRGGNILTMFSGDYKSDYLARTTGQAFATVFASFGLRSRSVSSREQLEMALRQRELVWMKTTADFKRWEPALWITPEGVRIPTVLGNDHAVVAIGFNNDVVVIRDVLGPTSSNWDRRFEYEVPWNRFMAAWEAQGFDAIAVERP